MGIVACTALIKMNSFVVLSAILGATMAAPAAQLIAGHGLLGAGYAGVGLAGHGLVGHAGLAGVGLAGHGLAYAAAPVAAVHAVPAVNIHAVHTTVPMAVPTPTGFPRPVSSATRSATPSTMCP